MDNINQVNMGYNKEREYDIRGIIIPRIGDILYYDRVDMQIIIQEIYDNRFYNERYILIGIVISISGNDNKTLKVLTPYFIETEFAEKDTKIPEKQLLKDIKSYVKKYMKDIFNCDDIYDDIKFNLTTKKDLFLIVNNSNDIIDKLSVLNNIINNNQNKQYSDIVNKFILLYNDDEHIRFTYGLSDNYNEISFTEFNNVKKLSDIFNEENYVETLTSYILPIVTVILT